MSAYRDLVYMVLDSVKIVSDDSFLNEQHIMFLLDKYRASLLKTTYGKSANTYTASSITASRLLSEANYQTLCLDLEVVDALPGLCEKGKLLRSVAEIPPMMHLGLRSVYTENFFVSDVALIEKERLRYVGHDRWRRNSLYASLGPDNHLWFKSGNPQFLYLKKAKLTAIFEEASKAAELTCENEDICDPMDAEFPLEEALIPDLINLIVTTITRTVSTPEDVINNANDDRLSNPAPAANNNENG